jgi:hypothetical protein
MSLKQPVCGVNSGGLYVLWEDYTYCWAGHDITVPKGFVWDGASAPTRSSIRKDGRIRAAALIHDYLYRNLGYVYAHLIFSRLGADKLFHEIMLEAGMSRYKARKAYLAVRWVGWLAWNKHQRNHKLAKRNTGRRVL